MGKDHTLFLENNGIIWASGNKFAIGTGWKPNGSSSDYVYLPEAIPYFMSNHIKIIDIDAGEYHNLAVDTNGRVYSWGMNQCGQCGVGSVSVGEGILPTLIEDSKDYKVDIIRCGRYHSYVRTKCRKHYLFGRNRHVECLQFDEDCDNVLRPHRVDQIIQDKCRGKLIDVFLGIRSTFFIVSIST